MWGGRGTPLRVYGCRRLKAGRGKALGGCWLACVGACSSKTVAAVGLCRVYDVRCYPGAPRPTSGPAFGPAASKGLGLGSVQGVGFGAGYPGVEPFRTRAGLEHDIAGGSAAHIRIYITGAGFVPVHIVDVRLDR